MPYTMPGNAGWRTRPAPVPAALAALFNPRFVPLSHALGAISRTATMPHEQSGLLCFTVPVGKVEVTAFLSLGTWRARHDWTEHPASLLEIYDAHRPAIDAAVTRKVQSGARAPVVLRASDI